MRIRILTEVGEIVVQLAHDPIQRSLARAVRVHHERDLARKHDAAHLRRDGHEFGRLAFFEEGVHRLE